MTLLDDQSIAIWTALKEVEEYIKDGIVTQMSQVETFGGKDMKPLISAHMVCERAKPFISAELWSSVSGAITVATDGLNKMLEEMRNIIATYPLEERNDRMVIVVDQECESTLDSFRSSLARVELLLKSVVTEEPRRNIYAEKYFEKIDGAYIESNPGTYIQSMNMSQDLTHMVEQIQSSIDRLQQQGKSPEEAQAEVAQYIATTAKNDPTAKEQLIKWGQSIGTATVTDVAKGAVKLAIRLAGIPIP
jgi:hypothetical protein